MAPTLIASSGNPRGRMVLAAAALAGAELSHDASFKMADNWKTDEFLAKHPQGYLPALEDGDLNLTECGAIAEYVASLGPNQTLIPSDAKLAASVSQWSYFAQTELFIPTAFAFRIFRNVYPYHKGVFNGIVDGINKRLAILDSQIQGSTWLVGERITLADVAVGSALAFAFSSVISAADRKKVPNVVRYYETYVNQSKVKSIYADVELVDTLSYQPPAKPEAAKAAEKPKAEKAPKAPKKKEADDEEEEEPLVPAEPKVKNPLDDLPKSAFNLEEWKRQYSNLDTRGSGGSLEWFYEKFDHEGFSIWRVDFKYNDELTQVFMSNNQVGGFFNRLEASRKYLFGSVGVLGKANDSVISGAVIIRGQDIKPVIDVAPDWESYEYTRLDVSKPADKEFFEGAMAWDLVIDGKEWADGKNFK